MLILPTFQKAAPSRQPAPAEIVTGLLGLSLGGTKSKIIPDNESGRGGPSMLISCLHSGLQDLGSQGGLWEAGPAVPKTWAFLPNKVRFKLGWLCEHQPIEPQFAIYKQAHSMEPCVWQGGGRGGGLVRCGMR